MPRRLPKPYFPQHGPDAPWLLDLYCGAGGAGVGYWRAGFNVVGVDIVKQPRYPFTFVQADALDVLRGQISLGFPFVAVHASPPCECYSKTQRIRDYDYPALIAPTRELLTPLGVPYVIENVGDARPELIDPLMLCGAMFPELRVYRHRLFESSLALTVPQHPKHTAKQTKMGRWPKPDEFIHVVGNFSGVEYARAAMDIPWMGRDELKEAIPPAYTEFLGRQLMSHIRKEKDRHMSRTHRTHLATDAHAARANTRRRLRTEVERDRKSAKAARKTARNKLRETTKEFIR